MSDLKDVIDLKSKRELFIDRFMIDQLNGLSMKLHVKTPDPFAMDQKINFTGFATKTEKDYAYGTAIKDGDRFRLYYRGFCEGASGKPDETFCYAESYDGINFFKPNLGRCVVDGSVDNNVIQTGVDYYSHNMSPMLDRNPDAAYKCRYKALAGHKRSGGLKAFGSEDGIAWFPLSNDPVIKVPEWSRHGFDSQNVSFWSEAEGCYVAYCRTWKLGLEDVVTDNPSYGVRWISRCTSHDFIRWSELEELVPDNGIYENLYTNQFSPYFRSPHIYIGLGTRLVLHGDNASGGNTTDISLFSTRGKGVEMNRLFMESFIRPGLTPSSWTNRAMYTFLNIIPVNDMQMAINMKNSTHSLIRILCRTDGLTSLHASYAGGEMITRPFTFQGDSLDMNFATSAAGHVLVSMLDEDGVEIPGVGIEDGGRLYGDSISHAVKWKHGASVAALQGRCVRLRFEMRDADVYSFQFRNTGCDR
jgi:hypothetical protein